MVEYEEVISFEALMDAGKDCCKNVMWKSSTQMFRLNRVRWACTLHDQLVKGTYKSKGFTRFQISERGKTRDIQAVHISERCVQKSLCKNALKPILTKSLIYDNAASLKDKGTAFALARMKQHLARHYRKHGRAGGILLMDYSNYFGSIEHKKLLDMLRAKIGDDKVFALMKHFIDCFDGDVGLGLGSEISQISAIFYPNRIDHYIKEQLHIEGYGRYMDDSYIIHEDLEYLKYCRDKVIEMATELGLKMNPKRTQIVKLDGGHFEYLKKRVHLSETGKVVVRVSRKNLTKRRRKLRKQKQMLDEGRITMKDVEQSYQSWRGYAEKSNSYNTIKAMDNYYKELFGKEPPHGRKKRVCKRTKKATGDTQPSAA